MTAIHYMEVAAFMSERIEKSLAMNIQFSGQV